jgi:hypothetical protein
MILNIFEGLNRNLTNENHQVVLIYKITGMVILIVKVKP